MSKIQKLAVWIFVKGFFRIWYRIVNKLDKDAEVIFMNYGFEDGQTHLELLPKDEINRYPIQLYHQLVKDHNLEGKDILEIGCGRGGGLAFIHRLFKPSSSVGIDRDHSAIQFCQKHYRQPGLNFMQGDAQSISLPDHSFDLIINVESCHLYERMDLFLNEVERLLRPGGIFLLTDFRASHTIQELIGDLDNSSLVSIAQKDVTSGVIKGLELDDQRRMGLIRRLVPKFLVWIAKDFSGVKGSPTFRKFTNREWVYFNFHLRKKHESS
jgi:ubiquinone/menaquinone biosynthesis C-methylase UbiE